MKIMWFVITRSENIYCTLVSQAQSWAKQAHYWPTVEFIVQ